MLRFNVTFKLGLSIKLRQQFKINFEWNDKRGSFKLKT
jgi:hypothetical protein